MLAGSGSRCRSRRPRVPGPGDGAGLTGSDDHVEERPAGRVGGPEVTLRARRVSRLSTESCPSWEIVTGCRVEATGQAAAVDEDRCRDRPAPAVPPAPVPSGPWSSSRPGGVRGVAPPAHRTGRAARAGPSARVRGWAGHPGIFTWGGPRAESDQPAPRRGPSGLVDSRRFGTGGLGPDARTVREPASGGTHVRCAPSSRPTGDTIPTRKSDYAYPSHVPPAVSHGGVRPDEPRLGCPQRRLGRRKQIALVSVSVNDHTYTLPWLVPARTRRTCSPRRSRSPRTGRWAPPV